MVFTTSFVFERSVARYYALSLPAHHRAENPKKQFINFARALEHEKLKSGSRDHQWLSIASLRAAACMCLRFRLLDVIVSYQLTHVWCELLMPKDRKHI